MPKIIRISIRIYGFLKFDKKNYMENTLEIELAECEKLQKQVIIGLIIYVVITAILVRWQTTGVLNVVKWSIIGMATLAQVVNFSGSPLYRDTLTGKCANDAKKAMK